jgi:hypothetical protein
MTTGQQGTAQQVDREALGRLVRDVWIAWAREQPDVDAHRSWLVGWGDLPERDREVDRRIAEAVVDAVRAADLPPLAELVTDGDIEAALEAGFQAGGLPATKAGGYDVTYLRAALEAYGARLLARVGRTPDAPRP